MPTAVEMSAAGKFAAQLNSMELANFSFTYQKIDVTFTDGGTTAADDWEARS